MDPTKSIETLANAATQINTDTGLIAFLAVVVLLAVIAFTFILLRALMKMNAETKDRTESRNKQLNDMSVTQATITANLAACSETLGRVNRNLDELFGSRLEQQQSIANHAATLNAHESTLRDHGHRIVSLEKRV
jgi:septal ring factor EnvC (AmiA/AmiB activator)